MPEETTPTPTPVPTPVPTEPPATPPATPPSTTPPTFVTVSADEYRALLARESQLKTVEAEQAAAAAKAEADRIRLLAEKGEIEKALTTLTTAKDAEVARERTRAEGLESQILTAAKTNTVNAGLIGADFVSPEAATQARELIELRTEVTRDAAGNVTVREKGTGKPAADFIRDWLASPGASHFKKASTKGGTGTGGGHVPPGSEPVETPATFSDRALATLRAQNLKGAASGHYGLAYVPPANN